ncbi:hypothetical protein KU306_12070 [Haloferax larsenii]|uniref:Uncharacterized protein n=1 Tax=Haloferax larsenii TaxID=302484 RepID=A0ABY5REN1_HALLR|nr:hypothetical protein [Haloferax larsenii]UVE49640.1 hypothetical protein KU306_12070 [Haloferax larsenii]
MSDNRHNTRLKDAQEEYYQKHKNEINLSKLLQEAVEDHRLRRTGNKERLNRQIAEKKAKITEKEAEIDELHSEIDELEKRLEQIDEAVENDYESVRNLLEKLIQIPPEEREAAVKRSDVQVPTVKVMAIVDAIDLHYYDGQNWENGDRLHAALNDADIDVLTMTDDEAAEYLTQMLPEEEEAFEAEWEEYSEADGDEESTD